MRATGARGEAFVDKETTHVLLCIWCQRRISAEELRSGRHDHVDVLERLEYDQAVNTASD